MAKLLYRYRPLEVVRDSYYEEDGVIKKREGKSIIDEIRNQEIYLGTITENNDPMDGRFPFIWKGDRVIWENFFKNYCNYLINAYYNIVILGDDDKYNQEIIYINSSHVIDIEKLPLNDQFESFYNKALSDEIIKKALNYFIKVGEVKENTLTQIFMLIHNLFLKHLKETLLEAEKDDKFLKYIQVREEQTHISKAIEALESPDFKEDQFEIMMEITHGTFEEQYSIMKGKLSLGIPQAQYKHNWMILNTFFPLEYIKKLKESIHSEYYLACFSDNQANHLMWSHYAGSHKGVCLVFELEEEDSIVLKHSKGKMKVKPIKYRAQMPEINIFENIGNLPYPILDKKWLVHNGKISNLANYYKQDEFHPRYWDIINEKTLSKFKDWEYEKEYRIVDYPMFGAKKGAEERLLKYDISQLKGIIFGMKTPDSMKYKIISELDKVLKGEQRKEFNIYQMRSSVLKNNLDIHRYITCSFQ